MRLGPGLQFARQGIAVVAALSVVAAGSGLPMCLTLLAQAVAPCPMHQRHQEHGAHHHAPWSVPVVSEAADVGCHPDSSGPGCASGGLCPAGGPAAFGSAQVVVVPVFAATAARLGPTSPYLSYLARPPSPPPKA